MSHCLTEISIFDFAVTPIGTPPKHQGCLSPKLNRSPAQSNSSSSDGSTITKSPSQDSNASFSGDSVNSIPDTPHVNLAQGNKGKKELKNWIVYFNI